MMQFIYLLALILCGGELINQANGASNTGLSVPSVPKSVFTEIYRYVPLFWIESSLFFSSLVDQDRR
jgi:hypothetical protein